LRDLGSSSLSLLEIIARAQHNSYTNVGTLANIRQHSSHPSHSTISKQSAKPAIQLTARLLKIG
jgi:hypothetical protein